jgi:hypothetical protein
VISYLVARTLAALHGAFVLFVVFGGLLVLAWPSLLWLHLLAIAWAGATLTLDLGCVLTRWEKSLYRRSGREPYPEGFLLHFLQRPNMSPEVSRRFHTAIGVGVLVLNVVVYAFIRAKFVAS